MSEPEIPRHTRGRRPHFFADPGTDQLLGIVLGVVQELSVLRDRVDAIHALLDRKGVVTREDLENYAPDAQTAAAAAADRAAYLQRVFRVIRSEAGMVPSESSEEHAASIERELSAAGS